MSVSSSQATTGEVAAPSRMERSPNVGGPSFLVVQRDNANTGEPRARNPWQSISVGCVGGWRLLLGEGDRAARLALTIQIVAYAQRRRRGADDR